MGEEIEARAERVWDMAFAVTFVLLRERGLTGVGAVVEGISDEAVSEWRKAVGAERGEAK